MLFFKHTTMLPTLTMPHNTLHFRLRPSHQPILHILPNKILLPRILPRPLLIFNFSDPPFSTLGYADLRLRNREQEPLNNIVQDTYS